MNKTRSRILETSALNRIILHSFLSPHEMIQKNSGRDFLNFYLSDRKYQLEIEQLPLWKSAQSNPKNLSMTKVFPWNNIASKHALL